MKILYKETFVNRLEKQIDYIARDSPTRARKFRNELLQQISNIPQNPYRYRKSVYFDRKDIRDLIFKGYTVVFKLQMKQLKYLVL